MDGYYTDYGFMGLVNGEYTTNLVRSRAWPVARPAELESVHILYRIQARK